MVGRIIWFLVQTGMRQQEVCSARWTQSDPCGPPQRLPMREKIASARSAICGALTQSSPPSQIGRLRITSLTTMR